MQLESPISWQKIELPRSYSIHISNFFEDCLVKQISFFPLCAIYGGQDLYMFITMFSPIFIPPPKVHPTPIQTHHEVFIEALHCTKL